MASCWFSLFLAASIATSVFAEAIVGSAVVAAEADAALVADDVCGTVEDPRQQQQQCALSALQRRGQRLEVKAADSDASDATGPAAAFTGAGPAPNEDAVVATSAAEASSDEKPLWDGKGLLLRAGKGGGRRGGGRHGGRRGGGRGHRGLHPHPHRPHPHHPIPPWHPHRHPGRRPRHRWRPERRFLHRRRRTYYRHHHYPSCQTYGCTKYVKTHLCQCNSHCVHYKNCCLDYVSWCTGPSAYLHTHPAATGAGQAVHVAKDDQGLMLAEQQTEKYPVVRTTSKYQRIDVWDVFGHSWIDGEHVDASRRLYLDGVLQLDTDDEYLYHEMLIHPAMLAHGHPEHVCILGGGDLAALHHVLRHSSVTSATLVEIDEMVVNTSKAELDFGDAAFDPRTTIVIHDAFTWLSNYSIHQSGSLDALFFDLLDITLPSPLLDTLFTGNGLENFIRQAKTALRADGFAVFQLGEFEFDKNCSAPGGANADCVSNQRHKLFLGWLKATFSHVQVYTQYVPSFGGMWTFALATENAALLGERWSRPAAELDAEISARIFQGDALSYVNGQTLAQLRFSHVVEAEHAPAFNVIQKAAAKMNKAPAATGDKV
mmetsp:Transcript_113419/g.331485  ORF Transcript_113419/g.331485 Transcript_113419/m.331485 type:complete len:600 (+) Transcript_113419:39-1838(+)